MLTLSDYIIVIECQYLMEHRVYVPAARVAKFLKSLKGAGIVFQKFEKVYMKCFRHKFFSPQCKWRCKFF